MINVNLQQVGTIRLNSFHPLCRNEFGIKAAQKFDLPPFIDASCRREPDLENPFPSISALCRQATFAPHLRKNQIVVYISVQGFYQNTKNIGQHHRLIAILKVLDAFGNHSDAANWYQEKSIPIPSNCMIEGNPPKPFEQTAGLFNSHKEIKAFLARPEREQRILGERIVTLWNRDYEEKSQQWGVFVITEPVFVELTNPPILQREDFEHIFGKLPNTRNPNIINKIQLAALARMAGINLKTE